MSEYDKLCWSETMSGCRFDPHDDHPQFTLVDLVWGCARAQRYAGQFRADVEHYSVAEHQVLMARHVMAGRRAAELSIEELLDARSAATHDLTEGLYSDLIRPLKKGFPEYVAAEERFARDIARRYLLPYPMRPRVKELDSRIIRDERLQAMNPSPNTWATDALEPLGVELQFWSPRRAAQELSDLLAELRVGHGAGPMGLTQVGPR